MSRRRLIVKLVTLALCLAFGIVLLVDGDWLLGAAHVIVLPLVMWSTWTRLRK